MNTFSLYINLLLFASSGSGFIYAVVKYFKPKAPLLWKLVVCSLGCMMLGRLFTVILFLTSREIFSDINVGRFGVIGGFFFLLSASYGQMNGLVDGGEKKYRKYRLISMLAPAVIVTIYIPLFISKSAIIINAATCLLLSLCSYFNLKHLIMPDINMGILKLIRGYNFLALSLTVLSALETCLSIPNSAVILAIVSILISIVYIIIVPILVKGAKKWTL